MSGVEVAGLALAVLPLVVNQLDNYARGIETIKGLRRYRWELEGYSSTLSAQYAIFLNTLEILLQDVVDDQDERSELISTPNGPAWKEAAFKTAIVQRLGRDYHAFTGTVAGLCCLLEELSHKLDRHTTDYSKAASIKSLGTIKFRKILSKAVYEDILNKIDKANHILKMITDQSHQLERAKGTTSRWRKGLKRHRDGRRHARVLYNMLVQGQGWKCSCRNKHTVCFRLDSNTMNIQQGTDQASKNRFLMMLSAAKKSPHPTSQWHEVEFLPEIIEKTVPVHLEQTSQQSLMSASEGRRRVQFATDSTTVCVEAVNPALGHFGSINDLCATLECFNNESLLYSRNPVGYISSQTSDVRFHVRHLKNIGHNLNLRSLQDMLAGSNQLSVPASHSEQLSRRNRLYLAATLACGVLQLHGNWLKQRWGTKDIVFVHDLPSDAIMFDHPYLLWQAATSHLHDNSTEFPSPNAIQNEILLPLAVALTELSLGKTIAALYTTDDQADSELQVHFNTATRTLRRVYCESGSNYGDVVKECLYWSRNKGERFEDPQFDESVFETVVSPLLKDFDYFEGISQAR